MAVNARPDSVQGRRLPDGFHAFDSEPGDYWRDERGEWCIKDPTGSLGALGKHEVIEHDDGTITVSPSILDYESDGAGGFREAWHGYLEHGVWRQV